MSDTPDKSPPKKETTKNDDKQSVKKHRFVKKPSVLKDAQERMKKLARKHGGEGVVIIGAGIAGLATGIALQNAGWKVRIYDSRQELKESNTGIILTPNAISVLKKIAPSWETKNLGIEIDQALIQSWHGYVLSELPIVEFVEQLQAKPVMIHRQTLHNFLLNEFGHKNIFTDWTCFGFEQSRGEVTALFSRDRETSGAMLIGADGINSTIRKQLLGYEELQYSGYVCWQGISDPLANEAFQPGTMVETHGRGARFGATFIDEGRIAWWATSNVPEGMRETDEGVRSLMFYLFQGWHNPIEDIIEATQSDNIIRTEIYDRYPVQHWGEGRVTLLGDAAHPMTPDLHQGAGAALEDAWVLSQNLLSHHTVSGALRAYEHQRKPRTADLQRRSWRAGQVGQWQQPVAVTLRDIYTQLAAASKREIILRKVWGWRAR